MDYYKLALPKTGATALRGKDGKIWNLSAVHLDEAELFSDWKKMERPYEMDDVVKVISGYHGSSSSNKKDHRYGIIKGVDNGQFWIRLYLHDVPTPRWEHTVEYAAAIRRVRPDEAPWNKPKVEKVVPSLIEKARGK